MKTFAVWTFRAWTYRCGALASRGPGFGQVYRVQIGQVFHAAATIGQDCHTGVTAGTCHG